MIHKILVIGVGGMGLKHIDAFIKTQRAKIYIYDVDKALCENILNKYAELEYCDLEDSRLLKGISGVLIASPTHTHIETAFWCAQHDKSFILEKPISNNIDGVGELIELCKYKSIRAAVAYPRRHGAAYKLIKRSIDDGLIGKLKIFKSNFSQDFRKYRPDYQSIYYSKLSQGGGILMDALTHHIDLAIFYAGPVDSISAMSDRLVIEGVEGDDSAVLNLRFKSGVLGNITGNQFQKPNDDYIELIGTHASYKYDRLSGMLTYASNDNLQDLDIENIDGDWAEILLNQAHAILDFFSGERFCGTTLVEGLMGLEAVLAAKQSSDAGQTISI